MLVLALRDIHEFGVGSLDGLLLPGGIDIPGFTGAVQPRRSRFSVEELVYKHLKELEIKNGIPGFPRALQPALPRRSIFSVWD